ncbi:MAG: DUF108 domain-containing protein [Alphaproteobacteria bacterium]|nr:DUF108 domain-containing protein [Alphaproteobacteria bacterium]
MPNPNFKDVKIKIGVAGCGALGSIVCKALQEGIKGYEFVGVSDLKTPDFGVPNMSFNELAKNCDLVVECLPPKVVPELAREVLGQNKDLIMISACALLLYPEIYDLTQNSQGRIMVPSGALSGLDAVTALSCAEIESAKIASTKPPKGFKGAPHVVQNDIKLDDISEKTLLFSGNAYEAAKAFPANVNVAASLSLAGIGPERTKVEVWADPNATGNAHEITVKGGSSTIINRVENQPDPTNPKSSMLAGHSIVAALKKMTTQITAV